MYKVIHAHCEKDLQVQLNEAAEEGYYLDSFQAYEGAEEFHYIAIMIMLEEDEDEGEE